MRAVAALVLGFVVAGAAWAEPSRLVPPGEPEPDCRAHVGYDRDQELPGYRLSEAGGSVCVPFLVPANRPPDGYGRSFYLDEFTDAKLKERWASCKEDPACYARLTG